MRMCKLIFQYFIPVWIAISCISCTQKRHEQVIQKYYSGFNTGNFDGVIGCITDSMVVGEMEYQISQGKKELYQMFQWDSVFQPKYKILEIKKDSNAYVATLWKNCRRIDFLQDTAITFKVKIDFIGNRISGIRLTEYIGLNFDKWQYRTEALIAWVDQNHPELSGFNNDLTLTGAQNYLKAVDLWKKTEITNKKNDE